MLDDVGDRGTDARIRPFNSQVFQDGFDLRGDTKIKGFLTFIMVNGLAAHGLTPGSRITSP
jgi:hypothetical protein